MSVFENRLVESVASLVDYEVRRQAQQDALKRAQAKYPEQYSTMTVSEIARTIDDSSDPTVLETVGPLEPASGYPDGNPKTAVGATKPSVRAIPPVALVHLGGAMADGEKKYGRFNWRDNAVTSSVYYDAAMRHLMAWWDGERCARDSGRHHLAHVMACCTIILDAEASAKLNDDRRADGQTAETIAAWTAQG